MTDIVLVVLWFIAGIIGYWLLWFDHVYYISIRPIIKYYHIVHCIILSILGLFILGVGVILTIVRWCCNIKTPEWLNREIWRSKK